MADQTTSTIVIQASPAAVMSVIADFAAYPVWAKGVQSAVVVEAGGVGPAGQIGRPRQVRFVLDVPPIRDEYTLGYRWEGDRKVSWRLVEGTLLSHLSGSYVITPRGDGGSDVVYALSVDLAIPLIGMLKRKGERILIETALQGLKQRVESR